MRRTLASRRDSRLGPTGEVYSGHGRWINEGVVADDDIFPWLRPLQIQGFELTIVGASLDAVRVCIEAWNAGFKPVLIIMEDRAHGSETAEVRQLIRRLSRWHGGAGMFTYGPRMIVSEGPKCLVQLDHKGRAVDVSVCTDNGGLHTLAETWQLFQGPAIIVDDVGTVGEAEQSGSRRASFLTNMIKERAAVVDPKFWEARYDPERLSFWAVGYRGIAPNLIAGIFQMLAVIAVNRYSKERYFWLYRALADGVVEIPCAIALTPLYSSALGLQLRADRPTLLNVTFGVCFWVIKAVPGAFKFRQYYFSDFMCSCVALTWFLLAILVFCKYVKHVKITMPMLKWYCAAALGTLGPWVGSTVTLLVYLVILGWRPVSASIYLTVAFCTIEAQLLKFMLLSYDRFVWQPRRLQPDRVPGDQKLSLATCVICIHGFTETGRLTSMICGAVRAKDVTFVYSNAVAILMGLVINVSSRSGWAGCLIVRHVGPRLRVFPRLRAMIERMLCPSAIQGLHIDVKFAMGWPRFFMMAGLCLGRGLIHNKWQFTMTGHDPAVWCWNGIVLVTAFMAFIAEIVEDWLTYAIVSHVPAPNWEVFGQTMVNRFDMPGRDDIYHPSHYIVPQSAFLAPTADDAGHAPSLKRSSVQTRIVRASTKLVQELAPALSVSPNFKHARYFCAFQLMHYVGGSIVLVLSVMSIGLGAQNLFGFCRPIRLEEFLVVLRNSVLWSTECEAEMDAL